MLCFTRDQSREILQRLETYSLLYDKIKIQDELIGDLEAQVYDLRGIVSNQDIILDLSKKKDSETKKLVRRKAVLAAGICGAAALITGFIGGLTIGLRFPR